MSVCVREREIVMWCYFLPRQLEGELRKVREERDRLLTELTQSQTQLTSLQSTHLPQQALER